MERPLPMNLAPRANGIRRSAGRERPGHARMGRGGDQPMTRALRALLGALAVAVVGITAYLTPAVSSITRVVLGLLAVVTFWYAWRWPQLEQRLAAAEESARA